MAVNRNSRHIPKKSYPALSPRVLESYFSDVPKEYRAGLVKGLSKVLNNQAVDERLNYDVIEKALSVPQTGSRSHTIIVASSDATDKVKEGADYVCDGLNDQVTIDEMWEEVSATGGDVHIKLTEGDFDANFNVPSDISGYFWLQGSGWYNTSVGDIDFGTGDQVGTQVSDLFCGDLLIGTVSDCNIFNNILNGGFGPSYDGADPYNVYLHDNTIYGDLVAPDAASYSVIFENGAYLWVHDNFLGAGLYASPEDDSRIYALLLNDNHIEGGNITLEQLMYLSMVGNMSWAPITIRAAGEDNRACRISGNTLGQLLVEDSNSLNIVANTFETNGNEGVIFVDTVDSTFMSNSIQTTRFPTFHNGVVIDLQGACHRNNISNNVGRAEGNSGPDADYFIQIGAGCNDNKVFGNDGFGVWDTAAVNDLGTGTDLTSANR